MSFGSGIAASAIPFAGLVSALSQILGRPVIDKTGIKGYYDLKIVFSREGIPNSGPVPPPLGAAAPTAAPLGGGFEASEPMPSIFTAIQEQMGLRLDSTKGPVDVLFIDSVSKPAEN